MIELIYIICALRTSKDMKDHGCLFIACSLSAHLTYPHNVCFHLAGLIWINPKNFKQTKKNKKTKKQKKQKKQKKTKKQKKQKKTKKTKKNKKKTKKNKTTNDLGTT